MPGREDLVGLYADLRDEDVLSVYVASGRTDPAERSMWTRVVENGLDAERARLQDASPDHVDAFDDARAHVEEELRRFGTSLPAQGWVGFATAEGLRHSEALQVPTQDLVRFERGIRVAPYVRAFKQARPVIAAVADSRKARIFRYREREVEEVIDMIADRDFGDLTDSVSSKRGGRFSGARGATGTDTARRLADRSAAHLQSEILDEIASLAGEDGFVVFGGTSEVEAALARQAERFGDRWTVRPSLHLGVTEAEAKEEIEIGASEITGRMQGRLLDEVVDAAKAGGRGCLGVRSTRKALLEGRVDTLLLSRAFREREPDLADHFVGTAFERGSAVEELSRSEGDRLEEEGEGVAARLRYTL